jgi:hypothetical protein
VHLKKKNDLWFWGSSILLSACCVKSLKSCEADLSQGANDSQVPSTQGQAWSMKSMNLPTPNSQHTIDWVYRTSN